MARPEPWRRERAAYPFAADIPTRWADLDLLGHINNVAMAGLFEEGRGRFNRSLALFRGDNGVRWLIAGVSLNYLAEAHHPHDVTIASGIGHVGTRSWTIVSGAFQRVAGTDTCVATCETTLVYTDPTGPVPFPAAFLDSFERVRVPR